MLSALPCRSIFILSLFNTERHAGELAVLLVYLQLPRPGDSEVTFAVFELNAVFESRKL